MQHGLRDLRVVDFSQGIAGAYASKLFADAGADVVKVEPPGGDPLRRHSASGALPAGRDGALFRFLHTSKRARVGSPDDPATRDWIAAADLVVESGAFPGLDPLALCRASGDDYWVRRSGDQAVVRSLVTTRDDAAPGDGPKTFRNLHVFENQGGQWKCVAWQITELK